MATLYEMTAQACELYELLQAEEIDEQTFSDTLEAIGVNEKIESYCQIIKQFQADADMFGKEIERMKARKQTAENGAERVKAALLMFLQASGQDKVKAGAFSVYTATTQAAKITDESKLPPEWFIPQPARVDKAGIKAALKAGAKIDGAELVNNTGVRIR